MNDNQTFAVYLLIGVAVFLAAEVLFLFLTNRVTYKRKVNTRLKMAENAQGQEDLLVLLRRSRGLTAEGSYMLPIVWFNRLVLQSGINVGIWRILGFMEIVAAFAFLGVWQFYHNFFLALSAAFLLGVGLAPLTLEVLRRRRRRSFEAQLPDALDVVVRSLRAGHPLPIAINMVSREMPDPIGSEFGLTSDEMSYGLDLDTALGNLSTRVGQEDLGLIIVAISIQSRTGGNLSEILSNLSQVVRARFKMRRRIKALSAEGRFSALALSLLPFLLFGILLTVVPDFYGAVWDEPGTKKTLLGAFSFMMVGNLIMYRMVNFKL